MFIYLFYFIFFFGNVKLPNLESVEDVNNPLKTSHHVLSLQDLDKEYREEANKLHGSKIVENLNSSKPEPRIVPISQIQPQPQPQPTPTPILTPTAPKEDDEPADLQSYMPDNQGEMVLIRLSNFFFWNFHFSTLSYFIVL